MIRGEYRKILCDVFDVLGFTDEEKERALEGFKKKLANELLKEVQSALSEDHRSWLSQVIESKQYDKNDPKVGEIQKNIDKVYSGDKMDQITKETFKGILTSYVNFMSQKVSEEKGEKLKVILTGF